MILEIDRDGNKHVTSLAFPRPKVRIRLWQIFVQMGRAFLIRMRSKV